ncbi:ABC transporter ATP-binding protein [Roseateles violae]|uniref:Sn-glycerol-3-phosphate ABC transporter ATP-binding protein UgpC n=1 Tax=Roseateles violae TaxID=3058042 RepID=A0ABT8DPQ5_9BURK|nr:sn-glycerol-3-phosphate ABC transporter ATP-binding protein UgpC [Pelomonas sp. PFR6]MDN3920334.1 sn-glycerol-3-phosphate ABC transporter ATP-binding protein UgpC [Pelomonas sp. PFR6]
MAFLDIAKLDKRFGALQTLHGIDLSVDEGEFVVFVGPSGCGKSTLLRLIAGLEEASGGSIHVRGRDLTKTAPSQRSVAMVFQSYALYPHMTVEQNLGFGMRMRGVPKATIAAKLARAVEILQLQPYLARKPGELSGGQCQRVAIGRALVQEPDIFLFDEPLSNLDAELRLRMRLEIAALHRELGKTMIYVTHDQVEAMTLADKIVVLRAGRVEQVGSPMALYADPCNEFVAGFIGSPGMNLLEARLIEVDESGRATAQLPDGSRWQFAARPGAALQPGMALRLGLRPEHGQLADTGLAAELRLVERLGASSYAHLSACGQSLCVAVPAMLPLQPGQLLHVQPQADWVYAFDEQGRSIAAGKQTLTALPCS